MSINIENGQNTPVDNSTEFYYTQCQIQQKDQFSNHQEKQNNTYEQRTTLDALTNMLNLLQTDSPMNRENNKDQDPSTVQNNHNFTQSTLKSFSNKNINKNKPKSLFANKQLNIDKHQHQQQPHIITSSHKSFSSIARSKKNIQTTNIQQDNFVQNNNVKDNVKDKGNKQKKALKKQDKHVSIQRQPQLYHIQPISGISLYQQVLAKNFEVIDGLLKKLNQIYSHQQGYDKTMRELSQKMHKLQVDNENIHHQFRTSHFMIDKKLNTISNDHANIMTDVTYIKRVLNYQSRQFKERAMGMNDNNNSKINNNSNKNGQHCNDDDDQYIQSGFSNKRKPTNRSRKQKRTQQSHQQFDNNTNINKNIINNSNSTSFINSPQSHNNNPSFKRSAHKSSILNKRSSRNIVNFSGFKQHNNLGKLLLQQINQANHMYQGQQSDQGDSHSNSNNSSSNSSNSSSDQSIDDSRQIKTKNNVNDDNDRIQNDKIQIKPNSLSTQNNMNINQQQTQPHQLKDKDKDKDNDKGRKTSTTNKSNQKHHHNNKRHINNSLQYLQINALKNYISKQVQKVSKHNQQLNKFTLLGFQTTINTKCQSLQQHFQQRLQTFTKQLMEQKINKQFRKSLLDQVQLIINTDVNKLNSKLSQHLLTLQSTLRQQIDTKSDKQQVRQDLKQILQLMNKKMHALVQNCYSKFAQRSQTKRAILFLQKKINKLIQAAQKFNFENVNLSDDDQEKVKCLSCNRSYGLNIKDNNNNNSNSNSIINNKKNTLQSPQPMFSQVHLLSQSVQSIYNNNNNSQSILQKNELNTNMMTTTKKSNRNYSPDNNKQMFSPQNNKHTVRFRELSKYNSVDDIFESNNSNKYQQLDLNNNNINNNRMKKKDQNSSFISSVNKLRHSQTSQSLHMPSSPSTNTNIKSKYFVTNNNTQQNKLSTNNQNTLSATSSNIKQRNWKQKASTMLKKQTTTINWRSKSQYKKV